MPSVSLLSNYIDSSIISVLKSKSFTELYEWQYNAILKGLDGSNMIIVAPTGAGKSLPAEVLGVDFVLKSKKKLVYVAPLRSLVREKFEDFKKWYKIGLQVGLAMGEYWYESGTLGNKDIIVTTYAKFVSLVNHKSSFLNDVGMVIIDEFHNMTPEIEFIVALAKQMGWRILALSATVGNLEELAEWMDARIYRSADRPIKLQGGVVLKGKIYWVDGRVDRVGSNWVDVVRNFVDNNYSVIVFAYSRRNAERYAKTLAGIFDVDDSFEIPNGLERFSGLLRSGVAFHHAGLKNKERNLIEELFRNGKIKVLVATRTLAMGVNLPADVVLIKDIVFVGDDKNVRWLDVMDVWQMLGRAGRRGRSKVGIGLIYTSKYSLKNLIIEKYFEGKIEDANSRLINNIDNMIVSYLAFFGRSTLGEIIDFIDGTYGCYLNENFLLLGYQSLNRLVVNGMVQKNGDIYSLTKLGKLTAQMFVSVTTAKKMIKFEGNDIVDVLWFIINLKEFDPPRASKKDIPQLEFVASLFADSSRLYSDESFRNKVKALAILMSWINGDEIEVISKKFNVGFGDIRVMLETAEWLSFALKKFKLFFGNEEQLFDDVVWMVKYGVTRELVPFVKMKGVGRKRAKQLANTVRFKKEKNEHYKGTLFYWVGG